MVHVPPLPLVFDTCQLVLSVLCVSELVGGDQPMVTGNGCVMGLQTVARCSLTDYRSSFNWRQSNYKITTGHGEELGEVGQQSAA